MAAPAPAGYGGSCIVVDPSKIQALLEEIRSWEPGQKKTVHELGKLLGLEPHVIQRIARSEGLTLRVGEVAGDARVNERAPTQPIEFVSLPEEDES